MAEDLLKALEASDVLGASEEFKKEIRKGGDAWEIHLSLFPLVQRVLNPPFINAHLPKMYSVCRDLMPYLNKEEIPALVQLEINEYARKPLMKKLSRANPMASPVFFSDVESTLYEQDLEKTTTLMATFYGQKGGEELSRRLLLLGSGYLGDSLGHSVSSASFILLEMMERRDQDPWPALVTLSDFFCKAKFHTTPSFQKTLESPGDVTLEQQMLRATSGQGIINMHNTITHYAIERTRRFFTEEEYSYMKGAWAAFMGNPEEKPAVLDSPGIDLANDYSRFYEIFSRQEAKSVVASLEGMILSKQGRRQLGRFFIRALCDQYQGHYDPHYLTGLGAALWTVEQYWNQAPIALNAIFQYLNFYFENIKSKK